MSNDLVIQEPEKDIQPTDAEMLRIYRYKAASKSDKTIEDYRYGWKYFEEFCQPRGSRMIPASPLTICSYATTMADKGLSMNTIRARLAAIGFTHEAAGKPNPIKDFTVKSVLKGIGNKIGTAVDKKTAIGIKELRDACAMIDTSDLRGKRDKAMLLVGYFGAFRRSELVGIRLEHITFQADQTKILLKKSKTDQAGKGLIKHIPILEAQHADICPTRALRQYWAATGKRGGLIFRAINRWGHLSESIGSKEIERLVKRVAESLGLDPADFAGHSLRSGFVTDATNAEVQDSDIMEQTHHTNRATIDEYRQTHGKGAMRAIDKITTKLLD